MHLTTVPLSCRRTSPPQPRFGPPPSAPPPYPLTSVSPPLRRPSRLPSSTTSAADASQGAPGSVPGPLGELPSRGGGVQAAIAAAQGADLVFSSPLSDPEIRNLRPPRQMSHLEMIEGVKEVQKKLGVDRNGAGMPSEILVENDQNLAEGADPDFSSHVCEPVIANLQPPKQMSYVEKIEGVKEVRERLGVGRIDAGLPSQIMVEDAQNLADSAHKVFDGMSKRIPTPSSANSGARMVEGCSKETPGGSVWAEESSSLSPSSPSSDAPAPRRLTLASRPVTTLRMDAYKPPLKQFRVRRTPYI